MTNQSVRAQTILRELNDAADEYKKTKQVFDAAQVEYEVARERFARTKEMASAMVGGMDVMTWMAGHPDLRYTGAALGDSIIKVLNAHAWQKGSEFKFDEGKVFQPSMNLEEIANKMDNGGFEFKSTAPFRETNAALIKLKGVVKTRNNRYMVADYEEILLFFKPDDDPVDELPF